MKRSLLFAFAFACVACESPTSVTTALRPTPADVSLAVTTNERTQVAFSFTNPCNGEVVALEGSFHLVSRSTADGAGGFHVGSHFGEHYEGVGTSGAKYVAISSNNFHFTAQPPFPSNSTQTGQLHLNRQGNDGVEDFVVKLLFHTTVNANGEVTSQRGEVQPECQ